MIQKLLKWSYDKLLPHHLRLTVDPFVSLRAPPVAMGFAERRVVFLAPHPDDDIAAFGGTCWLYKQREAQVSSVYMTDGRRGFPEYEHRSEVEQQALVETRQLEARRAGRIVGLDEQFFLDNRDGELAPSAKGSVPRFV